MVAVAQGAVLSASAPALAAWIVDFYGFLAAPDSLSFAILDISTETLQLAPTTVYSHTVDLTADKVQHGRYAAAWTVSGSLGRHQIRWTAAVTSTDQDGNATQRTLTWTRDFEVLAAAPGGWLATGYALVDDLRSEGLTLAKHSDASLIIKLREASAEFDRLCGQRWFEPRYQTWKLDGTWKPQLLLDQPVIGVDTASVYGEGSETGFKVFNRHLAGLVTPDDRDSPKLEFFITQAGLQGPVQPLAYPYPISASWLTPKVWPKGTQNVTLAGVFGYTDPDGSPDGMTPSEVVRATKLLVLRNLPKMSRSYDRFDALNRHRIKTETTREQKYELNEGKAGRGGVYTGDTSIDDIVERYSRPPLMSAV